MLPIHKVQKLEWLMEVCKCCPFVHREQWTVCCGGLLGSASEANGILSWGQTAGQEAQVVQLYRT